MIQAAVLHQPHTPLEVMEFEKPPLEPDCIEVRILASGVCHSDWHVVKGEWTQIETPLILGHEGAGGIEKVGDDISDVGPGDRVILSWKPHCGYCEMCQRGHPAVCSSEYDDSLEPVFPGSDRTMSQMSGIGTFATGTTVHRTQIVPIERDMPIGQAALIGCGVMTGVGAVINTAAVEPGSSVAVFGCGGVGLNCIQGARLANASPIIAVDLLDNKLDMAREFGATHVVNAGREDPVERIRAITGGAGAHYAFEAIGLTAEPFIQALECTRARGVTVYVGHAPVDTELKLDARMWIQEKTVIGSLYGSARTQVDFPRMVSLYKSGHLMLDELVTREYELGGVNDAFAALERGEVARSVLMME